MLLEDTFAGERVDLQEFDERTEVIEFVLHRSAGHRPTALADQSTSSLPCPLRKRLRRGQVLRHLDGPQGRSSSAILRTVRADGYPNREAGREVPACLLEL